MVELPRETHPFFVGCQFHPEYKSKPLKAHPLFVSFVRAAHETRLKTENVREQTEVEKTEIYDLREKVVGAGED
jgi:hypothetical protein